MRLTTKGRFAVTAMIDLGLRQSNGPVTLAVQQIAGPTTGRVCFSPDSALRVNQLNVRPSAASLTNSGAGFQISPL